MTRRHDLEELAVQLRRRREELTEAKEGSEAELRALQGQDRDPEFEEMAQVGVADYTLSRLIEQQRRELLMIDAALARMAEDAYGDCVDCGEAISSARLAALPFALRCETDARAHERRMHGGADLHAPTL